MKSQYSRLIGVIGVVAIAAWGPISSAQTAGGGAGSGSSGCPVDTASTVRSIGLLESLERITKGSDAVYDMMFSYLKNDGALGSGVFDVKGAYQSSPNRSSMPMIERKRSPNIVGVSGDANAGQLKSKADKVVY